MNAPWRHHFIPQLLLREFTDSAGSLFYFDKDEPRKGIQYNTPRALFYEKHLYSAVDVDTGEFDPSLELFYAKEIEDKAAPIIRKIVATARAGKQPALTAEEMVAWHAFWYFQFKRTPDATQPVVDNLAAKLQQGKIEEAEGDRELTPRERAFLADPRELDSILRNARVGAQSTDRPPFVKAAMESRGLLIAVIKDSRKAFVIGSRPIVTFPPPGFTNPFDRGNEIWLPVASDVALSPGGPPGSEILVSVTDHAAVRLLNEMMVDQSSQIAGRSKELVTSLLRRR